MNKQEKELSRTRTLGAKLVYATFKLLKEAGGQLPAQTIFNEIPTTVELNEWDLGIYEKTGNVRWWSILHFFSIPCVKTGYLVKQKGVWFLTKEGEAAYALGERGLLDAILKGYQEWKQKKEAATPKDIMADEDQSIATDDNTSEVTLEQMELIASAGIKSHIDAMNPYELQELVAALLRGMGYFTPFIAQRGKDGGVDITAYKDPLGATSPRIKVQVKHRGDRSSAEPVRQLMGLLQKGEDVGIFVSTGGFTSDARATARTAHTHVELIDLDRFIALWQEFYPKLSDNDKSLLPLKIVYFLAPTE